MDISTILDLLVNALVAGILLGGFYAAVSIGISIAFGMLDIANISHPAMIMLGSFMAFWLNDRFACTTTCLRAGKKIRVVDWPSFLACCS
jgi:branched-chain amino acid transport system permease protein